MARRIAKINIPYVLDDGTVTVMTLIVAMHNEQWRVHHIIGAERYQTPINSIMKNAFLQADIDYPANILAQVEGEQSISAVNRYNIQLGLAFGIIYVMNRSKLTNLDKYLVVGGMNIDGTVSAPKGISADVLANVAATNGLKTLGPTAAGCDRKIDTIVGLVK